MNLEELEQYLKASEMSRDDVAAIQRAVAELRVRASCAGPQTSQCLDEFAVADLVDGAVDPERRAAMLVHLASCGSCRSDVAVLARLVVEPAIRRELEQVGAAISRTTPRRRFVKLGGTIGAAAAAAVAILLVTRSPQVDDSASSTAHRAAVLTLSAPPVAVAPTGMVEAPVQFVWTGVPRADRYELTLFDQTGSILWQTEITDTVAVIPDSVDLQAGAGAGSLFWKVEARIDFDRWSESGLVEFTLMTPSDSAR
jgi:hypothetical protein